MSNFATEFNRKHKSLSNALGVSAPFTLVLNSYRPGNVRMYQIAEEDAIGTQRRTWPNRHVTASEMRLYLEGLMTGIWVEQEREGS